MKFITAIISLVMCFNICTAYAFELGSVGISTADENTQDYEYTINSISDRAAKEDGVSTDGIVTVEVTKTAGQNKNDCLIIALFDYEEHLVYTDYTTINLNEGETKSYDFEINSYVTFMGCTRVFVWDSLYAMKPLAEAAQTESTFGTGGFRDSRISMVNPTDLKMTTPGVVKFIINGSPYKAGWFKFEDEISNDWMSYFYKNQDKVTMIDVKQPIFGVNIDSNGLYVFVTWTAVSSGTSVNMNSYSFKNIGDPQ